MCTFFGVAFLGVAFFAAVAFSDSASEISRCNSVDHSGMVCRAPWKRKMRPPMQMLSRFLRYMPFLSTLPFTSVCAPFVTETCSIHTCGKGISEKKANPFPPANACDAGCVLTFPSARYSRRACSLDTVEMLMRISQSSDLPERHFSFFCVTLTPLRRYASPSNDVVRVRLEVDLWTIAAIAL